MVSTLNLECDIKTYSWTYIPMGTACSVKNLLVTTPNEIIKTINGQSETHYHNQNIKILYILLQTVNFIPSGIAKFLPQLEGIQIQNSKLKSVSRDDLKFFTNLKEIMFYENDIEKLDNDVFSSNLELIFVHFENNKLKVIGENILGPLKKLQKAYFRGNNCINLNADNEIQKLELKHEFRENCPTIERIEMLKEKFCDKEFRELKSENCKLKSEKELLKVQIEFLTSQNKKLKIINKNLMTSLTEVSEY